MAARNPAAPVPITRTLATLLRNDKPGIATRPLWTTPAGRPHRRPKLSLSQDAPGTVGPRPPIDPTGHAAPHHSLDPAKTADTQAPVGITQPSTFPTASEATIRLTLRAFVYRSSWSPPVIIAGRMVTVDDCGGAHWVLIQYMRPRVPGDLV